MADSRVQVEVSASIQGLLDGLKNATGAVKENTSAMQGLFGNLGKSIENLKAPLLAFSGILAGGASF